MKVLLIYPRLNYPSRAAICPPLGILYVASALRSADHEVSFLDLTHHKKMPGLEPLLKDIDLVGISITSAMAHTAFQIVQKIKLARSDLFCVAGGPHPTVMPEQTLKAGFDAVVIGEGDTTIISLIENLEKKKGIQSLKGIAFLKDNRMIVTEKEPFISDLDVLPFPARDLVDWPEYYSLSSHFDGIMASRGCPYRCLFCKPMQDALFGKKIRHRSPKNILDEINSYRLIWEAHSPLANMGIPFIAMFVDDMFLSKSEWVYRFCDQVERSSIQFWWGCQARVDRIKEDLVKRMTDAGCKTFAIGVESGSQKVLDFLKKDITVETIRRAFEICHNHQISTHAYIIIGSPEETKNDLQATYELLKEIKPTTCYIARATPVPGSFLYEYAKEKGILNVNSFDENLDYYYNRVPLHLSYLTPQDLDEFEAKVCELFPNLTELRKDEY